MAATSEPTRKKYTWDGVLLTVDLFEAVAAVIFKAASDGAFACPAAPLHGSPESHQLVP
jgi:hypothetical protein